MEAGEKEKASMYSSMEGIKQSKALMQTFALETKLRTTTSQQL